MSLKVSEIEKKELATTELKRVNLISSGTDTNVNGRVSIVGNASNLEHELANGYNSGDEYTGRTGNNLTLAEWQEVSIVKFEYSTIDMSRYFAFIYFLHFVLVSTI